MISNHQVLIESYHIIFRYKTPIIYVSNKYFIQKIVFNLIALLYYLTLVAKSFINKEITSICVLRVQKILLDSNEYLFVCLAVFGGMTLMSIKAVIFDLDGVIVDTAKYHYLAWQKLSGELGFIFTEKDNERLKGISRVRSLEILLEVGGVLGSFSEAKMTQMADRKNRWYVDYISKIDESEILEGTLECLKGFRDIGLKLALGSASKNAMLILNNLKIKPCFDAIIDGNKVSRAKPDPEVFLMAAKELNVAPEECIVFEDAQAGIDAAKKGGMKSVAIGKPENLTGYDRIYKGLYEVNPKEIAQL